MSTIVTGSLQTLQLFAILATLIFVIGAIVAFMEKSWPVVLVSSGLAVLSIALVFHP